ncbi:MAG: CRISPR-associated helicase Cas3' [Deltaproteobacteria bacterium]|nr:CRISPR-associated helicase Cas3' [Deltaproteobacteria bacterium]
MIKPQELLAKSPDNSQTTAKPWESLPGHTRQVLNAAKKIIAAVENSHGFQKHREGFDLFQQLALMGAIFHDLGKATNIFQGMLRRERDYWNKIHPVRHEILSALIIAYLDNPIKDWAQEVFNNNGRHFLWMVSWVAGGHHLKLHLDQPYLRKETDRLVRVQGTPREFIFWGSHPDVKEIVEMVACFASSKIKVPELQDVIIPLDEDDDLNAQNLTIMVEDYVDDSDQRSAQLSVEEKMALSLAKAVVIAADVAGSALTTEPTDPSGWIEAALQQTLSPEELDKVIKDKLGGISLRYFQKLVTESTAPVTLTIAGCGSGKTVAAYSWAKHRAVGKKLFFCYPTTGTASAGFEDYLLAQSTMERSLLHGRAQVDLERMLGTAEEDLWEENQRLESLKAWPQQVIACTVDTVLGIMQNQRLPLYSFPAIASGAFVFDEIHNYDAKLFGALLRFLKTFNEAPVLLMSASIPENRLKLLQETLGERLGDPITGDQELENLERYQLQWCQGPEDCWATVTQILQNRGKVLWVCNTVADAVAAYDHALSMDLPVSPVLYHSRFRYRDRVHLQEKAIKQFRQKGPALVVSTQVCEMSLDISADLMVTPLAPFPALIQRLGRLNRYPKENSPPCLSLVYDFSCPENRPYRRQELVLAKQALSALVDKPLSQGHLAAALEKVQVSEEIKTHSAWLDGVQDKVWQSNQRPLREGDASVTVILRQDLPEIQNELKNRGQKPNCHNVAAWTIPMYFYPQFMVSERLGGYPVAGEDIIEYDLVRGAKWRKQGWQII